MSIGSFSSVHTNANLKDVQCSPQDIHTIVALSCTFIITSEN